MDRLMPETMSVRDDVGGFSRQHAPTLSVFGQEPRIHVGRVINPVRRREGASYGKRTDSERDDEIQCMSFPNSPASQVGL